MKILLLFLIIVSVPVSCLAERKSVFVLQAGRDVFNGVCIGSNPEFSIIATVAHGTRNSQRVVICVNGSCYTMVKVYENNVQDLAILVVPQMRLPVAMLSPEPPPDGSAVELVFYDVARNRSLLVEASKFYQYSRSGNLLGYQLNERTPFFRLWSIRRSVRDGSSGGGYFYANKLIGIQSTTARRSPVRSTMIPSNAIREVMQNLYDSGKLRMKNQQSDLAASDPPPIVEHGSTSPPVLKIKKEQDQIEERLNSDCEKLRNEYELLLTEANGMRNRNVDLLATMQTLLAEKESHFKELENARRWKKSAEEATPAAEVIEKKTESVAADDGYHDHDRETEKKEESLSSRWSGVAKVLKAGLMFVVAPEVSIPTTSIGLALFGARWFLGRRKKKRQKYNVNHADDTSEGGGGWNKPATNPPRPSVPNTSHADTQYVPYSTDVFREAYNYAVDQYGRRYPGSIGVLQTVESMINQYLSGENVSGRK